MFLQKYVIHYRWLVKSKLQKLIPMQQDWYMAQASTFGLGWLGDGATIWYVPLLNITVMCGDANPVVMSICDSTNHMSEGGKKDVT